jgi:23S rRNA pseudouridine2605 synthase
MVAAYDSIQGLLAVRLAKYLAHAGVASRRSAEALIAAGRVSVAEVIVTDPARDVDEDSRVSLDGRPLGARQRLVVYALHKPVGVVSSARDPGGRPTVVELVPARGLRLYPVGRLDIDSSGLLLLTNDGELANRLTHPRFEVPKTYRARLGGPPVANEALRALRTGVRLDDGLTAPARARRVGPASANVIELTIHEGRNRQVRRMCQALGHPVRALERVRFGQLRLNGLAPGASRLLSDAEVRRLYALSRASAARGRAPARDTL